MALFNGKLPFLDFDGRLKQYRLDLVDSDPLNELDQNRVANKKQKREGKVTFIKRVLVWYAYVCGCMHACACIWEIDIFN